MSWVDVLLSLACVAWIAFCVGVVIACARGGRTDELTAQDAARERHYVNRAGVYQHPRTLR